MEVTIYEGFTIKRYISHYLTTRQPIRLNYPTGESMIARISDFDSYGEYYVTEIYVHNNELMLELRLEI